MTIADKLRLIANNVQKVFDGGKKAEYDAFWDAYQHNGEPSNYGYAFAGFGWTEDVFKPKYNIIVKNGANYMFGNARIKNLKQVLKDCNVTLDYSNYTGAMYATFIGMILNTDIPELDLSNVNSLQNCFSGNTGLKNIDKLTVSEKITNVTGAFQNCKALENVIFEGTLACSGLNVSACAKLTLESLRSILRVLSTNGSGKSITFATVHQSIIESDAECIEYATAAKNAGWTFAYN